MQHTAQAAFRLAAALPTCSWCCFSPADAFSVRNTLRDSNVAGKIDASDKERLEKLVDETIEWMDHNQVGESVWLPRSAHGANPGNCEKIA